MGTSRIYLTHCCAKKDNTIKDKGQKVPPDHLYMATPTQRFMRRCKELGVRWAILSDHYGIWFSEVEKGWYGDNVGDPNRVSGSRFVQLLKNFDETLKGYDEIYFYYNPGRFHRLYAKLLDQTALKSRIRRITHLKDIV